MILLALLFSLDQVFRNPNDPSLQTPAPVVAFVVPTSSSTYDAGLSSALTISGTATTTAGVQICTWVNNQGGSGTATTAADGSWSVVGITLTVGANVLTVTCLNAQNIPGSTALTVTRQAPPSSCIGTQLADAQRTTVANAITNAVNGTTLCLPVDTQTWTTPISITSKEITVYGAGSTGSGTNITCGGSGVCWQIVGASETNFVRLSNIRYTKGVAAAGDGMIQMTGSIGSVGFRFDHNVIVDPSVGGRGMSVTGVFGLVDNDTWTVASGGGSIQSLQILGSSVNSDQGFTPWLSPLSLGTANAVYVEDNTFTYTNNDNDTTIDCYSGARLVIRYSTFTGNDLGCHGTDSGSNRGPVSIEMYENVLNNTTPTTERNFDHRGGVFMAFNNTFNGPQTWTGFREDFYRADPADASNTSTWRQCDGTQLGLGSTVFSSQGASCAGPFNTAITCGSFSGTANVRFCSANRDLLCTNDAQCSGQGAGTCSTYLDGAGTLGYPCRDQPSVGPHQTVYGDYQWNNSGGGTQFVNGSPAGGNVTNWSQANRNFFDGKATAQTSASSPFSGADGVGYGTTARRPATCTTGVLYFDQTAGIGYQCGPTNTWTAYYTPYTYQHPLQNMIMTAFPLTENPISENGRWAHLDPTLTNVATSVVGGVHFAHGTQTGGAFDDSSAYLSGYALNQQIEGIVYKAAGSASSPIQEIELLLRWSDDNPSHNTNFGPTQVEGYEINTNQFGGYLNVGRFKDATALCNSSLGQTPQDGDRFKATIQTSGTSAVIKVYWNGTLKMTCTDPAPFTKGNPGIGFFILNSSTPNNEFGFRAVIASNFVQ